ncbi:MAG: response regulator transcription factor [Desulfobulbaceae bacterium]|uniref:Response regulator transcription factor n=1 Tax=Candidatus Desulfatifera sulfidica TaxID=2841691 RepID=A0A8J6NAQ0_9BACT|nr:response regulator transcription factor [Candidatus Desulfatifera sulfidica]
MNISVLLCDDHTIIREGLKHLLETQPDIRVCGEAANGREAVQKTIDLEPDVLVLDIAMPEMNGLEAARQIRMARPKTRVIILSVYSTPEHICHALLTGIHGYILKESAGSELIEAIRAVSGHKTYFSKKIDMDEIRKMLRDQKDVSPLTRLSQREREVLQFVVEGLSSVAIGTKLGLSPKTVETYRSRLMNKLGLSDLPSLVKFALRHGITQLE